jgi:pimeloyl-ACP methyl ester carboxylesterase
MKLHYRKLGSGNPVILLHGFPNDGESWNTLAVDLAQQFQLYIPDLPGAGKSPLPTAPLTLSYMATAVKEMMDAEGVVKGILVGHSMGGYTALEFAALFPDRVQGISLVHSSAYADSEEKKENRRKAMQLIAKGRTEQETFLRAMAGNLFAPSFADAHPEAVNTVVKKGMELPPEHLVAFYNAIMHRSDKTETLKQADFPVQFIVGEQDTATPMKDALEQCHLPSVSKINIYRNCGHMSMIEQPEALHKDLADFLKYCF